MSVKRLLEKSLTDNVYISEATRLARLNWWTVEYGLVGDIDNPKIYGAGLLSSIGESEDKMLLLIDIRLDISS